MQARYRLDYPGEFVILESKWSGGKKTETREWIPNPIENQHISGRAVCIGSRDSQGQFDYRILQRHRGGLLGTLKVQTYGTGQVAEDMRLDFAVDVDANQLQQLIENAYCENNVVYTTARNCLANPGEFYLIPQAPKLLLPALPVYLAAFDGHKEIFLLGYLDLIEGGHKDWQSEISDIFLAYTGIKFYLVGESTRMPDIWVDCFNTQLMTYPEFISYCDV